MESTILSIQNLYKTFGGIAATDHINLDIPAGNIHAVIGPNGAGKTTLIAQLSGELYPDSGRIFFQNQDITHIPTYRRSHLGIARSFQITSLMLDMAVLDNVTLAVQAHVGHSFYFWTDARKEISLIEPAMKVLSHVGLCEKAMNKAGELSHGEHRQLEIAMALATNPKLLLLDEPMAGMGIEEGKKIIEILKCLKNENTILLIEHDMKAVFALADQITVLVYGKIIASGSPNEIRANRTVRQAYLGDDTD